MKPFTYERATSIAGAAQSAASHANAKFVAGGTNLLDLMKLQIEAPAHLIDVNHLGLDRIEDVKEGGLRIGALVRNTDLAADRRVRRDYAVLSRALLSGASGQLRNKATTAGNLLQRTRCPYFYDTTKPCNKRKPGSGCAAIGGFNRNLAIMGTSDQCIATHPSDMCIALAALGAVVHVRSLRGPRQIPFAQFHRLPGETSEVDTTLADDELIEHIVVPPSQQYADHSVYLKLRERQSYAFALVSVAAALDLDGAGRVRSARVALGGVAHKPWRDQEAEELLAGQVPDQSAFEKVAVHVLRGAVPQGSGVGSNAFKLPMAHRAIVRALETALQGTVHNTGDNLR